MYKRIVDYSKEKNLSIIENRKQLLLNAYIQLDSNGNYKGIDVIERKKNKNTDKFVDERIYAPDLGPLSKTAIQPNPIAEKAEYILDKTSKKYPNWIKMMASGKEKCNSLKTVWNFIEKYDTDEDFANNVMQQFSDKGLKLTDFISFRIDATPVESMESDWDEWLKEFILILKNKNKKNNIDSNNKIISSISGDYQKCCPAAACPEIKNIPSASKAAFGIGACVYTASMKEPSYQSYGFEGAQGSQMGIDDSISLAAGLEQLLTSDENHNNDFQLIYIYENSNVEDLIGEVLRKTNNTDIEDLDEDDIEIIESEKKYQESLVSRILNSVKNGERPMPENKDIKFWMAHLNVPSQGRFYLTDEYEGSYGDLQNSLAKWYEDTSLITYDAITKKSITQIGQLLGFAINPVGADSVNKSKEPGARFDKIKSAILKAIFENHTLPRFFYTKALRKAVISIIKSNKFNLLSLQIIKCYLIRNGVNLMPELSTNNSTAYNCGRLFATYEKMQSLYNRDNNYKTTLAQNYFSGVLRHPNLFLVKLAKLAEVYRTKIEKSTSLEMLLGDLSSKIGDTIPTHFNDIEQGEFVLGYYQQRAKFIYDAKNKPIKTDDTTPETDFENSSNKNHSNN